MPKVIGIVGSRRRDTTADLHLADDAFMKIYEPGDSIVSGGCSRGGDRFAEVIAIHKNVPIRIFPADWAKNGRAAGFMRNTDIAESADKLIAVVSSDRNGGTEDTIRKFLKVHDEKDLILV